MYTSCVIYSHEVEPETIAVNLKRFNLGKTASRYRRQYFGSFALVNLNDLKLDFYYRHKMKRAQLFCFVFWASVWNEVAKYSIWTTRKVARDNLRLVEIQLKGGFPFSFFCRGRDFFLLSSELPCGMKWKTIQLSLSRARLFYCLNWIVFYFVWHGSSEGKRKKSRARHFTTKKPEWKSCTEISPKRSECERSNGNWTSLRYKWVWDRSERVWTLSQSESGSSFVLTTSKRRFHQLKAFSWLVFVWTRHWKRHTIESEVKWSVVKWSEV